MFGTLLKYKSELINSSHVFVNKALNATVPFFLIPHYNKLFGIEDLGQIIYAQSIITILQFLVDYGFNVTAVRDLSKIGIDKREVSIKVSSIYAIKLFLLVVAFIILLFFLLIVESDLKAIKLYSLTFISMMIFSFTPYWFFQGIKTNAIITWVNLVSKVVLFILIGLILTSESPLFFVPLMEGISNFLAVALSIFIIFYNNHIYYSKPSLVTINQEFKNGKNVFITSILNWAVNSGAIIVLGYYANETEAGYFAAFSRLAYYTYAVLAPISLALFPYISEKFSVSYSSGILFVKRILKYYILAVFVFIVGVLFFFKIFFNVFFDHSFLSKLHLYIHIFYVLILWIGLVLINYFIGLQCLVACGRDRIYSRYYFINVVVTVIGFSIFVPRFSALGASLSMLSGELLLLALLLIDFRKASKLNDIKA